ncbi:MAG: YihA family ribosome biogenesis GTP-binding protein [Lachnospiraceae bacterium]|nr:YihA family ribosome biogenesis GTP-binding protein [Lachnospiraceae bacterium]
MIIKSAVLETVCGITSRLPENEQPEFAFAGRSNVGKSSLINGLMNRKSLARVSAEPGKTRTINYYHINDAFYFVDLPGYGFAKVSEKEKAAWGKMIERYLNTSKALKQIFLLADIRHAPSAADKQMADWIRASGREPVVIATKLDKINRSQRAAQQKLIRAELALCAESKIFPYSALSKEGREEIYQYLEECL